MILMFDEDIGRGVPHALSDVGYDTVSVAQRGWTGRPDVALLTIAGQNGWVFLSANKKMLQVPHERDAIVDNNVGVIFLTSGEERIARVLHLLLHKWDDIDFLDQTEPRPFAWFLNMRGQLLTQYRNLRL